MANMTQEERALVTEIQTSYGAVKKELRDIAQAARRLAKINRDAGRLTEANAAGRVEADAHEALGKVQNSHMNASDALIAAFDDGGGIVAFGGGGR